MRFPSLALLLLVPLAARAQEDGERAAHLYLQGRWEQAEPLFKSASSKASTPAERVRCLDDYRLLLRATGREDEAARVQAQSAAAAKGLAVEVCPRVLDLLLRTQVSGYPQAGNCAELRRAFELMPALPLPGGDWWLVPEHDLRTELKKRFAAAVPQKIFPLGLIERRPAGRKPYLLVLGQDIPKEGRFELLLQAGGVAGRSGYDSYRSRYMSFYKLGYYALDAKTAPPKDAVSGVPLEAGPPGTKTALSSGRWREVDGGVMPPKRLRPPEAACLPCRGPLCPADVVACFTDYNHDGVEEIHLDKQGGDTPGLLLLEAGPELRTLLEIEEGGEGNWIPTGGAWRLETGGGEGVQCLYPGECRDGKTYRYDPQKGVWRGG